MKKLFLYFSGGLLLVVLRHYSAPNPNVLEFSAAPGGTDFKEVVSTLLKPKPEKDTLGEIIQYINFEVQTEDKEDFEDGIIPWIDLDDPKPQLKTLIEAEEDIIPYPKTTVIIDYPLNNPTQFTLQGLGKGMSRRELVLAISQKYHEIYAEEEAAAKIKTVPADKRGTLANRNETDGKYGIWGHDLSDLVLSRIEVHKNRKGRIVLTLSIES